MAQVKDNLITEGASDRTARLGPTAPLFLEHRLRRKIFAGRLTP